MTTSDKKYQIFISSTYKDLIKAREEVTKVILNMYHIPIGMEMFSADNEDQWATIQETIDSSDYYLLIIGHRYGSETAEGISYTKKEFEYAKDIGVPIYAYIRNRDVATSPTERDKEAEKTAKLDAFIQEVEGNSMVEYWQEPSDLGQNVSIALTKGFKRRPRVGWVRADMAASPQTLEELATLSKENRELKERIQQLEKGNLKRPDLRVFFNGEEKIELSLPERFTTTEFLKKATYGYTNELYPTDLHSEASLMRNKMFVNNFNKWFEDNPEEVEKYNKNIQLIERAKISYKELFISVQNQGTLKANDINITVMFPNGAIVYDKESNLHDKKLPYPQGAPVHPDEIENKATESKSKPARNVFDTNRGTIIQGEHIKLPSNRQSLKVINNTISFYVRALLHTQTEVADEDSTIGIMAFRPGVYSAKVIIICEEYSEPDEYEIPIIISEIKE